MAGSVSDVASHEAEAQRFMSIPLILASGSPRRHRLLSQLGLSFSVHHPDVDESILFNESPEAYVTRLADSKSLAVSGMLNGTGAVVLAADTTVVLDGNILGKPESKDHGIAMLQALSDSTHEVLTGVSITNKQQTETFCVKTEVVFRKLGASEIEHYWMTGEPRDKAGGYGLQGIGAVFVSTLNGSYTNVIGLPLAETLSVLRTFGVVCLGSPSEKEFSLS